MNRKSRKKTVFTILGLIISAIFVLGITDVREQRTVTFRVKGKVFEAGTKEPLKNVKVLLVLKKPLARDKEKIEQIFEIYEYSLSEGEEKPKDLCVSGDKGGYIAKSSAHYGTRYTTLFGIERPMKHPYDRAWLIFRSKNHKDKKITIETKDWRTYSPDKGHTNTAPDVYLPKKDKGI